MEEFREGTLEVAELKERLACMEARLDAVLAAVDEAVCIVDERDCVVAWNRYATALYGISSDEIVGKHIGMFFSNLLLTQVVQERKEVRGRYHTPCPDKHVLINAMPVHLAERNVGGVCAERDITEVVQLNEKLFRTSEEMVALQQRIEGRAVDSFASIYGHSQGIQEAIAMGRRVAASPAPVLIRGESGCGKELFARALHQASGRTGAFVAINCGAIPEGLFESELFGYQGGAFTGADRKGKAGLLEEAHEGTLFLDEIGDMPREAQVKLLRALQEKSFYRVGGSKAVRVDVRIVAATHRDLEEMVERKEFREDLYYRLNVVTLWLPPLRDRRDDIPELVHKGLQHFGAVYGKLITKVDPDAMAMLLDYPWPGNVRELFNVLERIVVLAEGDVLESRHLPQEWMQHRPLPTMLAKGNFNLADASNQWEKEVIRRVLKENHYNKAAAAKKLGIPRTTLYYKLRQLELD